MIYKDVPTRELERSLFGTAQLGGGYRIGRVVLDKYDEKIKITLNCWYEGRKLNEDRLYTFSPKNELSNEKVFKIMELFDRCLMTFDSEEAIKYIRDTRTDPEFLLMVG